MASLAGRRLAELLQEQQEPFLLDVYLLENGYSGRSVCTEATATCWPAGTACRRLQRLACSCHGFQWRREGILGSLVGVFARRRPLKGPNWRRGALEDGGSPSSSSMARKARSTREDAGELGKNMKVDAERAHGWECTEEAKQLSPVSVLELQSDDGSPAHDHAKEDQQPSTSALHVQVGLQGSASSSSRYMRTIRECYGRRQALLACLKEGVVEEEEEEERSHQSEQIRDQHLHDSLGSHRRGKARRRQRRRAGDDAMAAAISHLAESDVWVYSMKWNLQLINSHVIEIVAEVGDAILDELIDLDLVSHTYD